MLSMRDLPPRSQRDAARKEAMERAYGVEEKPKMAGQQGQQAKPILTISDLPRREQAILVEVEAQREALRERGVIGPFNGEALPEYVNAFEEYPVLEPRKFSNVMRNGAWNGRRCFVVGGGPSLAKFDWSLLAGELTIGINRAFEKFDPCIMFSMDNRLLEYIESGKLGELAKQRYYNYKGNRVWSSLGTFLFPGEIYTIERPNPTPRSVQLGTVELLDTRNNSGYGAVNLAIALGANPIYLLGFDMQGDGKGNQKWWHDGYPDRQKEDVYTGFIREFGKLAKKVQGTGIRIVNLNKKSKLKCFEFGDQKEVFAEPKPKYPLFVSFYTSEGYRREAYRLMESLHRFGIEYDILEAQDQGGWHQNTRMKPEFVLAMMEKHPERDIVWVDADAVVQRYPEELGRITATVGVHVVDWTQYPNTRRMDRETLSGTVYFSNTELGRSLVRRWAQVAKDNREMVDQVALGTVLATFDPAEVAQLPATYCQIFDTMAMAGDPVIEHFQASRRLR